MNPFKMGSTNNLCTCLLKKELKYLLSLKIDDRWFW